MKQITTVSHRSSTFFILLLYIFVVRQSNIYAQPIIIVIILTWFCGLVSCEYHILTASMRKCLQRFVCSIISLQFVCHCLSNKTHCAWFFSFFLWLIVFSRRRKICLLCLSIDSQKNLIIIAIIVEMHHQFDCFACAIVYVQCIGCHSKNPWSKRHSIDG